MEEKFVLIDTDAGTDDAMAILMALQAHQDPNISLKVVAIVCVNGNTKLDNVCMNVTRLTDAVGANDVPIYRGSSQAIVFPHEFLEHEIPFHGKDGFGDAYPPITPRLEAEHGISAIIKYAHMYKGKLTILALGPLTNIAMAVRTDPSIVNCVNAIYAMGGNIEGVGNVTVSAEFNFSVDPEAAFITLSTFTKSKIIIVPWEVCLRQGVQTLSWRLNSFKDLNTPGATLLNAIEQGVFAANKESQIWIPCDQLAAAALIEPKVVTKLIKHYCTVELHGNHTRGLMIVDYPSVLKKPHNAHIVAQIDQELIRKMLIWSAGGPHYEL